MKTFLTTLLLAFSCTIFAQYSVKGTVINENGEPLIGASVFFTETIYATITDELGQFQFDDLPVDIYELKVTYIGYASYSQEIELAENFDLNIQLKGGIFSMDEIEISANKLEALSPFTYSEVNKESLNLENLAQDLPYLLEQTPSMVVTSDAGAGIGYTGMRIRGSDASRINVTVNGVPLNDSESHGVFWVNMPDFASSVDNVQIQRGVGPSTNGAAAFGATVGLNTNYIYQNPFINLSGTYGSFNTKKMSLSFGTGLINDKFTIDGRYSRITSDGYVDRASSELSSYYFSAAKIGENHSLRMNVFSGKERTYQSWNGVPESRVNDDLEELRDHYNRNLGSAYLTTADSINLFDSHRTYNYYQYQNQVDDYRQTHFQLIYNVKASEKLVFNATGHLTRGKGFFEQYEVDQNFSEYDFDELIVNGTTFTSSDLIRRKWLDNYFYGVILNADYKVNDKLNVLFGGGANRYDGGHYGRPVFVSIQDSLRLLDPFLRDSEEDPIFNYYENDATKDDVNLYAKVNYALNNKFNIFLDLQGRMINYTVLGEDDDMFVLDLDENYKFFNPKIGFSYAMNDASHIYASYARSNREPVRSDFVDAKLTTIPEHETLNDIEIGYRRQGKSYGFEANLYLMNYDNQLVNTGAVNNVGGPVRQNVDKSNRMGIELLAQYNVSEKFSIMANATFSRNKIDNFIESVPDYLNGVIVENEFENTDIAYSPNIISAATLTYRPIKELSINWLTKYVGSQFLDNTSNDNRKLDSYLVNDVVIAYLSKFNGINNYEIKLMVNNVLDAKYSSNGYTFNYLYGDLVVENYLYPQAGINFLLGASVSF